MCLRQCLTPPDQGYIWGIQFLGWLVVGLGVCREAGVGLPVQSTSRGGEGDVFYAQEYGPSNSCHPWSPLEPLPPAGPWEGQH